MSADESLIIVRLHDAGGEVDEPQSQRTDIVRRATSIVSVSTGGHMIEWAPVCKHLSPSAPGAVRKLSMISTVANPQDGPLFAKATGGDGTARQAS